MSDCLIYLLSDNLETDEDGNQISEKKEKQVFAEVGNISQKEFFEGSQTDLKPDYKFIIWDFEYSSEKSIRYNDKVYCIYRTYKVGDRLELYVTESAGI